MSVPANKRLGLAIGSVWHKQGQDGGLCDLGEQNGDRVCSRRVVLNWPRSLSSSEITWRPHRTYPQTDFSLEVPTMAGRLACPSSPNKEWGFERDEESIVVKTVIGIFFFRLQ